MRAPGDHVVLRQRFRGRVWSATTGSVVADSPELMAVWLPAGAPGLRPVGGLFEDWTLRPSSRAEGTLRLCEPGAGYSLLLFGLTTAFEGWYVNLEDSLVRTPHGWDFEDHLLDVWVDRDGSWQWEDEDELAEAVARGVYSDEDVARLRTNGEAAVERIARGELEQWLAWRPDPAWTLPPRHLAAG